MNDSFIFRKRSSFWSFWVIPLIGATSRLLCGSLIKLNVNNCITELDWLRHHRRQVRAARGGRSSAPTHTRATLAPWLWGDRRRCLWDCTEPTSRRSAACLLFPVAVSLSRVDGPLHTVAPDVGLICMTVLLRALPTRSNAKHADKGKGSDLEMTKWSKGRSKDEVAEEKRLHGDFHRACWGEVTRFVWHSWCSAGTAGCLCYGQSFGLAARRLILHLSEVGGGATHGRKK